LLAMLLFFFRERAESYEAIKDPATGKTTSFKYSWTQDDVEYLDLSFALEGDSGARLEATVRGLREEPVIISARLKVEREQGAAKIELRTNLDGWEEISVKMAHRERGGENDGKVLVRVGGETFAQVRAKWSLQPKPKAVIRLVSKGYEQTVELALRSPADGKELMVAMRGDWLDGKLGLKAQVASPVQWRTAAVLQLTEGGFGGPLDK